MRRHKARLVQALARLFVRAKVKAPTPRQLVLRALKLKQHRPDMFQTDKKVECARCKNIIWIYNGFTSRNGHDYPSTFVQMGDGTIMHRYCAELLHDVRHDIDLALKYRKELTLA